MPNRLAEVDAKLVEQLASIHCTQEEIAAICNCSVDTLQRRFKEIMQTGQAKGRCSLKRWQWKAAEKGSIPMLIWLGKQYLNQTDEQMRAFDQERDKQAQIPASEYLGVLRKKIEEKVKLNSSGKKAQLS